MELRNELAGHVGGFKLNDALDNDPSIIKSFSEFGLVFADPKLLDIEKTVRNRARVISARKPGFITVHASGGIPMMKAALEGVEGTDTKILAVTVLTNLNDEQCVGIYGDERDAIVTKFAGWASEAGVHGIVCSAHELEMLSEYDHLKDLIKVVPGIRPKWFQDASDDQKMVMTPAEAIKLGANYLVIGRPITDAKNPVKAADDTFEEIQTARLA
ncbi:MAG: orotidine-5'-phosphate decarboxylase [Nanoarchaeota archaeon]|nr:orotidine-5'-phosphate decarboxylase [Nanoarchaeota archaeon]MBU1135745.1 orotidine-5'-phosphate decarboxylase [Nanoarchaeota archaeon]MBU2520166.1 orotidine-5'-phosphate decarboxylase [Nanoarchaeota archaeon]